jgi:hypothetical protein
MTQNPPKPETLRQQIDRIDCLEALTDPEVTSAHFQSLVNDFRHASDDDLANIVLQCMTDDGLILALTFNASFVRAAIAHTVGCVLEARGEQVAT